MSNSNLQFSTVTQPGNQNAGLILTGAGLLLVLALTLWPSMGTASYTISPYCVICGSRGLADAVLNIFLFTPFGAGLSMLFRPAVAVIGSVLLSAGIELAQTGLVGRYPTLGDVVFNTIGGGCGAFLVYLAQAVPGAVRHRSRKLAIMAATAPVGVFLVTAALVSARYPETDYHGQWKHELGHLIPYPGEVLSASVGGVPLPDGLSQESEAIKEALEIGEPIRLSFVAAAPTHNAAHLLAIFDENQTQVFLITILGRDLRFEWRSGSSVLRLDQPIARWEDVVPGTPGDTAHVRLWRQGNTHCMEINTLVRCGMAGGVEESWRLLYRVSGAGSRLLTLYSAVWLIFLCVPAGTLLAATTSRGVLLGIGLGGFGVAVSWWSPFMDPRWVTFLAPPLGVLAGTMIRRMVLRNGIYSDS